MFKVLENKKHLKRTHTMAKDNVIEFKKPEPFVDDPITDVLRTGADRSFRSRDRRFFAQYRDLIDRWFVAKDRHDIYMFRRLCKQPLWLFQSNNEGRCFIFPFSPGFWNAVSYFRVEHD
jgi:hypothetical protein